MKRVRKAVPFFLPLFILLVLAFLFVPAPSLQQQGPTRYVNNTDPTCQGKSPCYATIQAAVNPAGTANIIRVTDTCSENVTVREEKARITLDPC